MQHLACSRQELHETANLRLNLINIDSVIDSDVAYHIMNNFKYLQRIWNAERNILYKCIILPEMKTARLQELMEQLLDPVQSDHCEYFLHFQSYMMHFDMDT